jgi:glycosyltransferase involved in cell wall biosynthesis
MKKDLDRKLCYILPFYDPNTETHYLYLYELIERLGEKVDIFLVIEKSPEDLKIKNLKGYYIQKFRFFPLRILELSILLFVMRIRGYRKFYIHYSILPALIACIITKLFGGEAYLWSCVENKAYFARWQFNKEALKRKLLVDVPTILAFKWIDFLVTCSHFMGRYYERNFGLNKERILVIPNWVNTGRLNLCTDERDKEILRDELDIKKDRKVLLYVSTLGEHKGTHYLPLIAEKLRNHDLNTLIMIVGDGPYREKLKEEIERRDLKDTVRIIGKVPNRLVKNYFAISDVFIHPALREEFGRILLEAMAMGVPFVSTDGGGGVLAFTSPKQKEYIVPSGEIDLFSRKVIELLNNKEKMEELRQEGLRVVKEFTLDKTVHRFKEEILGI